MKGGAHEDLDTNNASNRFAYSRICGRLPGWKERRIYIGERVGSRAG